MMSFHILLSSLVNFISVLQFTLLWLELFISIFEANVKNYFPDFILSMIITVYLKLFCMLILYSTMCWKYLSDQKVLLRSLYQGLSYFSVSRFLSACIYVHHVHT